jgi:hypothetical protein
MEQTAMQTLISYIQKNEIEYNKEFIFLLFDLLKLEKSQIQEAFMRGHCDTLDQPDIDISQLEIEYYESMYNNENS